MAFKLNPITGNLDLVGLTQAIADGRYVIVTGDTMEGDLIFPVTGFIMTDSNSVQWRVTINTDGSLQTDAVSSTTGTPMGLLLSLTYPT